MALEFRPARAEEMDEYVYSGRIGFGQSTAPIEIERQFVERPLRPEWTLCAFDDGVLAAKLATLPFTISWNGRWIRCGGVTAVTALPTHRRRGHVGELMRRALAAMHEAGQPLAMLWATMSAIYQRFGYGNAFTNLLYEFDARRLQFVDAVPAPGRTRLLKSSEAQAPIEDAYTCFAAQRTLMLRRGEDWWPRALRLRVAGAAPLLVATYEEAGDVRGYMVYEAEDGRIFGRRRDQRLQVFDFVWLTPAAHRALIQLLAGYDLAHQVRFPSLPADDPLFHQVQEPRELNGTITDGTLLRIVDVRATLEGRGYDADGRVTLALKDDLCPWNSGAWRLEVEGGSGRVRPGGDDQATLRLSPRALAMLACGYQSATALARSGLITCADGAALASADNLFRTACAPFCMDHF